MTDKESGTKEIESLDDPRFFSLKTSFFSLGASPELAHEWAKTFTDFLGTGPEWGTRWFSEKRKAIITILQEDSVRLYFSGKRAEIGAESASISWQNGGGLIACKVDETGQLVLHTSKNEYLTLSRDLLDHQVKISITDQKS